MTKPLFSILIANYNNGHFFQECYDSIITQTYDNWEVVIVDDCSADNSIEIIEKLIAGDSRFRLLVNEKNGGCGYTKRRCAEEAKGELAGFLDPDDALMPNAVEAMVKKHVKHPDVSLVHSNALRCNEKLQKGVVNKSKYKDHEEYIRTSAYISHFISFKMEFYLKTEGINAYVKRAVDQDLYLKLEEVGDFVFLDKVLYKYRVHERGISLMGNADKAKSWLLYVVIDACNRRNLSPEDILPIYINTLSHKIGSFIIKPIKILRRVLRQLIGK